MNKTTAFAVTTALILTILVSVPSASGQFRFTFGNSDRNLSAQQLANGTAVRNLSLGTGESLMYCISVPHGAQQLTVTTGAGRGDVDLYVRHGKLPSRDSYDFRSIETSTVESITIRNPAEGMYFIRLSAFRPSAGFELRALYEGGRQPGGRPGTGLRVPPDKYENNDSLSRPSQFKGNQQVHTIHHPGDTDWMEYVPPTMGFYKLNITATNLPLKVQVYTAQDQQARPFATFGTAAGQASVPLLAMASATVFLVGISSPRGKTGAYRIGFEKIEGLVFGRGHRHGTTGSVPPGSVPPVTTEPVPDLRSISADTIRSGEKERNLDADRGDKLYYRIYVPRSARSLQVIINDGKGNADLYLKFNGVPTLRSEMRSVGPTNGEVITISNPSSGWYYIMIYARSDFEDLDLLGIIR